MLLLLLVQGVLVQPDPWLLRLGMNQGLDMLRDIGMHLPLLMMLLPLDYWLYITCWSTSFTLLRTYGSATWSTTGIRYGTTRPGASTTTSGYGSGKGAARSTYEPTVLYRLKKLLLLLAPTAIRFLIGRMEE